MASIRNMLLASAALSLLAIPAVGAPQSRPIVLAQAEGEATSGDTVVVKDPVTLAEEAVEEARTALRAAMASGDGIAEARQKLRDALKALEDARVAAGLPPSENPEEVDELVPPAEQPPTLPEETPPVVEEPPPALPAEQPPVVEEPPPAPPTERPPVIEETPPAPPSEQPPLVIEEPTTTPAEQPPVVEETPPPPATEEAAPPTEPQVTPPADQLPAEPPPVESVPPPVVDLPPPVVEEPPPPPPPAATEGVLDLQKFSERPKFGETPPATVAAPAPPLPQSAEVVKEGTALPAPDGRVIIKNQGQITIIHDDSGRFRQRGDRMRTDRTENETETTTVIRPDGTEIVTVRDRWGNIVQRYRKNPNGSVEILIGEMEQPGFVGRIFGRSAQPAPPPQRRPPAPLNLQFGPLVISIPQQQYIVESSRASEEQLQFALLAPPVEAVERPYTLEEIRRSGRLRDKVRRIDFDTITFDTGKATVPDNQIQSMQNIGLALRSIIQQDPSQVFLIEGHTDAVGPDLSNLALSDRRAETVAEILSYYFAIPPENLITQGYGEQFLKIPTVAANRENRRVAFRNITYLLRTAQQ